MKGFKFRLQPVLAIRGNRLESLQRQLATSTRSLEAEKSVVQQLENEKDSQHRGFGRIGAPGPLDLGVLEVADSYLVSLDRQIVARSKVVEEKSLVVEEEREAVLGASRDKKAMEKLRADALVAFVQEIGRKEQSSAEELASARYLLRMRTEVAD
jgi:flagellar export protein FliJ